MSKRVFTLLAAVPLVIAQESSFKPYSVPVSQLLSSSEQGELSSHLVSEGIVSISMGDSYRQLREETLVYSTLCSKSVDTTAKTSFFDDGTQRSTLV
jgi:hypothetical protein